jgi:hypothetical protein
MNGTPDTTVESDFHMQDSPPKSWCLTLQIGSDEAKKKEIKHYLHTHRRVLHSKITMDRSLNLH